MVRSVKRGFPFPDDTQHRRAASSKKKQVDRICTELCQYSSDSRISRFRCTCLMNHTYHISYIASSIIIHHHHHHHHHHHGHQHFIVSYHVISYHFKLEQNITYHRHHHDHHHYHALDTMTVKQLHKQQTQTTSEGSYYITTQRMRGSTGSVTTMQDLQHFPHQTHHRSHCTR